MQPIRFHKHHGQNIAISEEGTTATRTSSFAHGICFGNRPINQGEIFLVEILENERGWSGHLRIGLTQHNPNTEFPLPQYALPDFVTLLGRSWVMAVTKTQKCVFRDETGLDENQESDSPSQSILGDGDWIRTRCGTIRRSQLLPNLTSHAEHKLGQLNLDIGSQLVRGSSTDDDASSQPTHSSKLEADKLLPTDVGSRLGLLFTRRGNFGDLYFIVNGVEHGPMARDIPTSEGLLWPLVDVYGTTKQVRIIHLTLSESLQTLCRDKIIQQVRTSRDINLLPLPKKLKMFLRYET